MFEMKGQPRATLAFAFLRRRNVAARLGRLLPPLRTVAFSPPSWSDRLALAGIIVCEPLLQLPMARLKARRRLYATAIDTSAAGRLPSGSHKASFAVATCAWRGGAHLVDFDEGLSFLLVADGYYLFLIVNKNLFGGAGGIKAPHRPEVCLPPIEKPVNNQL